MLLIGKLLEKTTVGLIFQKNKKVNIIKNVITIDSRSHFLYVLRYDRIQSYDNYQISNEHTY